MISQPQRRLPDNTQHKRQASVPSAWFEPAIPASERPQTHALDRAATGIGWMVDILADNWTRSLMDEKQDVRQRDRLNNSTFYRPVASLRLYSFIYALLRLKSLFHCVGLWTHTFRLTTSPRSLTHSKCYNSAVGQSVAVDLYKTAVSCHWRFRAGVLTPKHFTRSDCHWNKGKGKFIPRTGHEGPEGE